MKDFLLLIFFVITTLSLNAQDSNCKISNFKSIDDGGSGLFKAIAICEKSLPQFVVYRPKDLYWATTREKKLPVLIWGNGGCMDNFSRL